MKNISKLALASVFCAGACLSAGAQNVPPAIPSDPVIEANIQEWLQKMTLEEKIGQMYITISIGLGNLLDHTQDLRVQISSRDTDTGSADPTLLRHPESVFLQFFGIKIFSHDTLPNLSDFFLLHS